MKKIKYLASSITAVRIAGSFLLLFLEPLSAGFFAVYILCCVSDILDGYAARKTKTASRLGESLDSLADFVLAAVLLIIFIPLLKFETWMLCWIAAVALIRFASLGVGYAKYRGLTFLHTYANKITGAACACFPFLFQFLGLAATTAILCGIASLSAAEELIISILSKKLDRNIKGFLHI